MKSLIGSAFLALLSGVCLTGCSGYEEPVTPDSGEKEIYSEAPISISVLPVDPNEEPMSRAKPPGHGGGGSYDPSHIGSDDGYAETKEINKVEVFAFRRIEDSEGEFNYDSSNHQLLDCTEGYVGADGLATTTHWHKQAKGVLKKVKGYEYRLIAIAYKDPVDYPFHSDFGTPFSGNPMSKWMTVNTSDALTLSQFKASFASFTIKKDIFGKEIQAANIPQLFFGECHESGQSSNIIKFRREGKPNIPVEGLCLRGMAKVELRVKMEKHFFLGLALDRDFNWVALVCNYVRNEVGLTNYDDFMQIIGAEQSRYYTAIAYKSSKTGEEVVLSAWLLPGKVRLGLHGCHIDKIKKRHFITGHIKVKDISYGDMATGVISPDAYDNVFYLRRNHKYVFSCDGSEKIFKNKFDLP